ncbi:hypothetical protein DPMN_146583 [Dreissena polymorpha]|uniref:Uncharacterized protein n=1 Tax=Dreissena polymorpha TaxID=45954 RepID=A0A9D4F8V8_DREPO|nr:hypothetical protein DPMN_146583 [Dreissena polymorpha]
MPIDTLFDKAREESVAKTTHEYLSSNTQRNLKKSRRKITIGKREHCIAITYENVMVEMKEREKEYVINDVRDASRDSTEQQSGITSVQDESDADTYDDDDDEESETENETGIQEHREIIPDNDGLEHELHIELHPEEQEVSIKPTPMPRRSGRNRKPPIRYDDFQMYKTQPVDRNIQAVIKPAHVVYNGFPMTPPPPVSEYMGAHVWAVLTGWPYAGVVCHNVPEMGREELSDYVWAVRALMIKFFVALVCCRAMMRSVTCIDESIVYSHVLMRRSL